MVLDAEKLGGPSTSADDHRLTKFGKFLRKHKLDELPQLINVLKGEMSLVGPRPEVPSEVETYDEETKRIILSAKPGMTDLATLADIHEEEILKGSPDPHQTYREIIKPQKLKLAKEYVKNRSFWLDIKIILKTIKTIFS
jgi:lipopolysaccharide/colanic/teichoic acid biosynthesis glycosyltransferase